MGLITVNIYSTVHIQLVLSSKQEAMASGRLASRIIKSENGENARRNVLAIITKFSSSCKAQSTIETILFCTTESVN